MARIEFPCGAKGEPDFCPDLCRFGKFCKVKDKKEEPRGQQEESSIQEMKEDVPKVETYY